MEEQRLSAILTALSKCLTPALRNSPLLLLPHLLPLRPPRLRRRMHNKKTLRIVRGVFLLCKNCIMPHFHLSSEHKFWHCIYLHLLKYCYRVIHKANRFSDFFAHYLNDADNPPNSTVGACRCAFYQDRLRCGGF